MLVEKFKEICLQGSWQFNYGAGHWQNVQDFKDDSDLDFENRKKYFLLLWQDREVLLNEYGAVIGYEFTGESVFCVRSKISDEDYNYKYEAHIKNLRNEISKIFNSVNTCEEWTIKRWKEVEVENEYDTNVDGLKIEFTFRYDDE